MTDTPLPIPLHDDDVLSARQARANFITNCLERDGKIDQTIALDAERAAIRAYLESAIRGGRMSTDVNAIGEWCIKLPIPKGIAFAIHRLDPPKEPQA